MRYSNLHELINNSHSSRQYFLSLPVDMQMQLHKNDSFIHSAHQLHTMAEQIQKAQFLDTLGHW